MSNRSVSSALFQLKIIGRACGCFLNTFPLLPLSTQDAKRVLRSSVQCSEAWLANLILDLRIWNQMLAVDASL